MPSGSRNRRAAAREYHHWLRAVYKMRYWEVKGRRFGDFSQKGNIKKCMKMLSFVAFWAGLLVRGLFVMIRLVMNNGKRPVKLLCKNGPDDLVRKCHFGKAQFGVGSFV